MISPSELAAIRARAEAATYYGHGRDTPESKAQEAALDVLRAHAGSDIPRLLTDAAECRALIAELVEVLSWFEGVADGDDISMPYEQVASIRAALSRAREVVESPLERFERIASEFERDTGMLRPGKDVPAAMGSSHTDEERAERFAQWMKERKP